MTNIDYRTTSPDPTAFFDLFETTEWNEAYRASPDELARANAASWRTLSAFEGDRLVGFGRVVGDGVLHATVFDLIVHPTHRGRGIGSEILCRLIDECRRYGIRDVQLFAARGKRSFYEQHGFTARPDDAPGMELRR